MDCHNVVTWIALDRNYESIMGLATTDTSVTVIQAQVAAVVIKVSGKCSVVHLKRYLILSNLTTTIYETDVNF